MPFILKAVASIQAWSTKENSICSSLMEESVSNLSIIAVLAVIVGIGLVPFLFGTMPVLGIVGFTLAFFGSSFLSED